VGPLDPIRPSVDQSGKLWRTAVLAKRQEIMDERLKNLPATSSGHTVSDFKPDEVKVVNKNYIDAMFNAASKSDNNIIENVVVDYELNTEQQRAFNCSQSCHATQSQKPMHVSRRDGWYRQITGYKGLD